MKNIKHTIQRTKWSFGIFEPVTRTNLGRVHVDVPKPVLKQIDELWAVSQGNKSHTEALKEIKEIGQEVVKQSHTWTATAKSLLFTKDETQKYFDSFETEETFNQAFGLKK